MKRELNVFFTALMFYTRIPVPKSVVHSQEHLNDSTRYFPLMGWIVGGAAAGVFYLSSLFFSLPISVLLSMVASILITGAFHEDGFADTCDGFGGGWTKDEILKIMKDSRIGTYGTIGLILILFFKLVFLVEINASILPIALIVGHSLSRSAVIVARYTHQYVRANDDSKAKPLAKNMSLKSLIVAVTIGLMPLILLKTPLALGLIIPVMATGYLMIKYFKRRIGGYTGDCLGSIQQVSEIVFYASFVYYGHLFN